MDWRHYGARRGGRTALTRLLKGVLLLRPLWQARLAVEATPMPPFPLFVTHTPECPRLAGTGVSRRRLSRVRVHRASRRGAVVDAESGHARRSLAKGECQSRSRRTRRRARKSLSSGELLEKVRSRDR